MYLLVAAVSLVIIQQPLSQSDTAQQVLDETLDSNFPTFLLSCCHIQKLLDGYDLPAHKPSRDLLPIREQSAVTTGLRHPVGNKQ